MLPRRPIATVVTEIEYLDPAGLLWVCFPGEEVNGLSTPWFFWRLLPPFSWRGIRPSILHDVACTNKSRTSKQVHDMLYYAMRCENVSAIRAYIVWRVVTWFGPRF